MRHEVVHELLTPKKRFSDHTINYFIEMVCTKTEFRMLDVLFYPFPENYRGHLPSDRDDVQIIFGGDVDSVGHFICVYYNVSKRTVYVYDSLHKQILDPGQMEIVTERYPNRRIKFVEPKTRQKDDYSCGAFVIAYATTLILGHDPGTVQFEMDDDSVDRSMKLRKHIHEMFANNELKAFPTT